MTRFTTLDAIVLVCYLGGTTALGLYVGRKQRDAKDYFVADGAIPWWAVMFSIVASETSALTFISIPGLAYGATTGAGNLGFLEVVAGYIIGRFVVAGVLLPRYFAGNLVTAYALLETRFGLTTRRFTSIVFMVTRALANSVRAEPRGCSRRGHCFHNRHRDGLRDNYVAGPARAGDNGGFDHKLFAAADEGQGNCGGQSCPGWQTSFCGVGRSVWG